MTRARLLAAAATPAALLAIATGFAAAAPEVRVATSGNHSELVETLPITRRAAAEPQVVMSLRPSALPRLAGGDKLRLSAELQVTGNCVERVPRCVGPPYSYAPRVRARLVIARDAKTTGGPGALAVGPVKREHCTQRRPQYEHHCVLVFGNADLVVNRARLPCRPDRCRINLVADANHPRARRGDLLMVGGQKPDGTIPQDRGRLNAVWMRDTEARDIVRSSTTAKRKRRVPLDFRRRVIISKRLDRLERDEQLAVSVRLRTDISRLPYAVRSSARLILADRPNATKASEFVKAHARLRGEIAENNGENCTQPERVCTIRKVGVAEIRRSVERGGRPVPLYVNLVTVFGPKSPRAQGRDRVIMRRAAIDVERFAAALHR